MAFPTVIARDGSGNTNQSIYPVPFGATANADDLSVFVGWFDNQYAFTDTDGYTIYDPPVEVQPPGWLVIGWQRLAGGETSKTLRAPAGQDYALASWLIRFAGDNFEFNTPQKVNEYGIVEVPTGTLSPSWSSRENLWLPVAVAAITRSWPQPAAGPPGWPNYREHTFSTVSQSQNRVQVSAVDDINAVETIDPGVFTFPQGTLNTQAYGMTIAVGAESFGGDRWGAVPI